MWVDVASITASAAEGGRDRALHELETAVQGTNLEGVMKSHPVGQLGEDSADEDTAVPQFAGEGAGVVPEEWVDRILARISTSRLQELIQYETGSSGGDDGSEARLASRRARGTALATAGLDRGALAHYGLAPADADRVYRALFVYTTGFHRMLGDVAKAAAPSRRGHLTGLLWQTFGLLLEACSANHFALALSALVRANRDWFERKAGAAKEEASHLTRRALYLEAALDTTRMAEEDARSTALRWSARASELEGELRGVRLRCSRADHLLSEVTEAAGEGKLRLQAVLLEKASETERADGHAQKRAEAERQVSALESRLVDAGKRLAAADARVTEAKERAAQNAKATAAAQRAHAEADTAAGERERDLHSRVAHASSQAAGEKAARIAAEEDAARSRARAEAAVQEAAELRPFRAEALAARSALASQQEAAAAAAEEAAGLRRELATAHSAVAGQREERAEAEELRRQLGEVRQALAHEQEATQEAKAEAASLQRDLGDARQELAKGKEAFGAAAAVAAQESEDLRQQLAEARDALAQWREIAHVAQEDRAATRLRAADAVQAVQEEADRSAAAVARVCGDLEREQSAREAAEVAVARAEDAAATAQAQVEEAAALQAAERGRAAEAEASSQRDAELHAMASEEADAWRARAGETAAALAAAQDNQEAALFEAMGRAVRDMEALVRRGAGVHCAAAAMARWARRERRGGKAAEAERAAAAQAAARARTRRLRHTVEATEAHVLEAAGDDTQQEAAEGKMADALGAAVAEAEQPPAPQVPTRLSEAGMSQEALAQCLDVPFCPDTYAARVMVPLWKAAAEHRAWLRAHGEEAQAADVAARQALDAARAKVRQRFGADPAALEAEEATPERRFSRDAKVQAMERGKIVDTRTRLFDEAMARLRLQNSHAYWQELEEATGDRIRAWLAGTAAGDGANVAAVCARPWVAPAATGAESRGKAAVDSLVARWSALCESAHASLRGASGAVGDLEGAIHRAADMAAVAAEAYSNLDAERDAALAQVDELCMRQHALEVEMRAATREAQREKGKNQHLTRELGCVVAAWSRARAALAAERGSVSRGPFGERARLAREEVREWRVRAATREREQAATHQQALAAAAGKTKAAVAQSSAWKERAQRVERETCAMLQRVAAEANDGEDENRDGEDVEGMLTFGAAQPRNGAREVVERVGTRPQHSNTDADVDAKAIAEATADAPATATAGPPTTAAAAEATSDSTVVAPATALADSTADEDANGRLEVAFALTSALTALRRLKAMRRRQRAALEEADAQAVHAPLHPSTGDAEVAQAPSHPSTGDAEVAQAPSLPSVGGASDREEALEAAPTGSRPDSSSSSSGRSAASTQQPWGQPAEAPRWPSMSLGAVHGPETMSTGVQTDDDAMGAAVHAAMTEREAARACVEVVSNGMESLRDAAHRSGAVQVLAAVDVVTRELDEVVTTMPATARAVASCFRRPAAQRSMRSAHERRRTTTAPGGPKPAGKGREHRDALSPLDNAMTQWSPARNSPSPPPPPISPNERGETVHATHHTFPVPREAVQWPVAPLTAPPARQPPTRRGLRVHAPTSHAEAVLEDEQSPARVSRSRGGRTETSLSVKVPARALIAASRRANRAPPSAPTALPCSPGTENALSTSLPSTAAAVSGGRRWGAPPGLDRLPGGIWDMHASKLAARVREHHLARELALAERRRRHARTVTGRSTPGRRFTVPRPPTE